MRQIAYIRAFFSGEIIPPYEAEVQPSSKCNAKCTFCWETDRRLDNNLVDFANFRAVTQKIIQELLNH